MPEAPPTKTDSSRAKLDAQEFERLSQRLGTLEQSLTTISTKPAPSEPTSHPNLIRMRLSLKRARNAFRRLGNGSFALSGLTLAAFLKVLFDGNLSLLPAFIIVTAALFFGLVGYLFHMQADGVDMGDTDD